MTDTQPKLSHLFSDLAHAEKYLHECQCKVSRFRSKFVSATDWHNPKAKVKKDPSDKPRLVHTTDIDRLDDLTEAVQDAKSARDVSQARLIREFAKLPTEVIKRHAQSEYPLQRRIAKHCLATFTVSFVVSAHVQEAMLEAGVDMAAIARKAVLKAYEEIA